MSDYTTCRKCGGRIVIRKMDGVATPIHVDGGCTGTRSSTSKNKHKSLVRGTKTIRVKQARQLVKSFTIPNAKCPECGQNVFYYENEHGSKVFFDDLGPPWPKHPCTDSSNIKRTRSTKTKQPSKKQNWKRFYLEPVEIRKIQNRIYITYWKGFYLKGNGEDGPPRMLYSITKRYPHTKLIRELCFWKKVKTGVYELSLILNNEENDELTFKAFSKSKFDELVQSENGKLKLTKEGQIYWRSVRAKDDKGNSIEMPTIQPVEQTFDCPLCSASYESKEQLRHHLDTEYEQDLDKTILAKMSKSEWIDFVINNLGEDQDE